MLTVRDLMTTDVVAIVIVGLTCLAAGIVVGAVHGLFLISMLSAPAAVEGHSGV